MDNAQPGIFVPIAPYHVHLEYSFAQLPDKYRIGALIRKIRSSVQQSGVQVLFGFSERTWSNVSSDNSPEGLRPFQAIEGTHGIAPSTQADIWVWIQGESHDANFDAEMMVNSEFEVLGASCKLEVTGFARHENRDFTGFIDGTENPENQDAEDAVLIPNQCGGTFAFTQQWQHDLKKFHSLPQSGQESVIGRTKPDSIELEGHVMPEDSHVSRTDAEVEGVKMKILRRSVPYGTLNARGLHFVAFACSLNRIQVQLDRMFGASGDGLHDRLVDFSRPLSGSFWFVPSKQKIVELSNM